VRGYLLDTNVPSEFTRSLPEPRVVQWLKTQAASSLFLSVVTIGEIRKGLVLLPEGSRRRGLEKWLNRDLLHWFSCDEGSN
jgi:predicted nucleic acid-binding protein